jgi:hypothetical protein
MVVGAGPTASVPFSVNRQRHAQAGAQEAFLVAVVQARRVDMIDFERETRAARNEAMFRAVNEKVRELNDALSNMTDEYAIACECADGECIQTVNIRQEDYLAVRSSPRQFVVLRGHVVAGVEQVVSENDGYMVVEKLGAAGELATKLADAPTSD